MQQHQTKKPGMAEAARKNKIDQTSDDRQEGNELFVDASIRLDEEDVKENDMPEAIDEVAWNNEKANKDLQGVDKAPGEEQGKGERVTQKDLKGKSVDADPSKEEGKPVR